MEAILVVSAFYHFKASGRLAAGDYTKKKKSTAATLKK